MFSAHAADPTADPVHQLVSSAGSPLLQRSRCDGLFGCTVLFVLLKLKKIPEPFLILGASLVGLIRGA
jgi:hypothetical protein